MQAFLLEAFLSSLFSHFLPSLSPQFRSLIAVDSAQNTKLCVVSNLVQALKRKATSYVWVSLFICLFLSASDIWPWVASNSGWMRMNLNPCCFGCFSRFLNPLPCLLRESKDITFSVKLPWPLLSPHSTSSPNLFQCFCQALLIPPYKIATKSEITIYEQI